MLNFNLIKLEILTKHRRKTDKKGEAKRERKGQNEARKGKNDLPLIEEKGKMIVKRTEEREKISSILLDQKLGKI